MPETAIFSPEFIRAIAILWKLAAALCILVAIVIFRDSIRKAIVGLKNLRIKRGGTEVSVEQSRAEEQNKGEEVISAKAKQEPEKEGDAQEVAPPKEPAEWFSKMLRAFRAKKFEEAEEAFEKLQASEENAVARIRNQAFYHGVRYTKGLDPEALQKLEKLTENEEARESVLSWLANCHEFARNYPKAIETHRRALSEKLVDEDRARHTVSIAKCMSKMGQTGDGLKTLTASLNQVEHGKAKAILYKGIADLQEIQGNSMLRAIALQKVLEYKPEDQRKLFDAAYAQSAAKLSPLSATNYHTLLKFAPDNYSALNNLCVECEALGMSIKSVNYYKQAVEHNNTVAMSNVAYRYINQGFEQEAREILDKANSMENPHRNVGEAIANLADRKENEEKKWEDVIDQGVKQQQFFWLYAEAYFEPINASPSFEGEWVSKSGNVFVVEEEGKKIVGKWESEKDGEKFEGCICNLSAEITYQEKEGGLGLLSKPYWGSSHKGFACLSRDRKTLNIHIVEKDPLIFLVLTKKAGTEDSPTKSTQPTGGGDAY